MVVAKSRYEGKSLRDVYASQCEKLHCRKNSYLLKTLSNSPNDFGSLTELDLSLNFVGRNGIKAVLEVIRISPNVQRLCLADNWLNNDAVKEIVAVLTGLSNLHHLDLSRNPISHTAGKILSDYISRTPAMQTIQLDETLINPALVKIIEGKAAAHMQTAAPIQVARPAAAVPAARPPSSKRVSRESPLPNLSSVIQGNSVASGDEIAHLEKVFEVLHDDNDNSYHFLSMLQDVMGENGSLKSSPRSTESQPVPLAQAAPPSTGALSVLQDVMKQSGEDLSGLRSVFQAEEADPPGGWYGLGLIQHLVRESQVGTDDWEGLTSVLNLIQSLP